MRSQHLFVYGTLCAPEVMAAVTGLRLRTVCALLHDHQVRSLHGQVYPGLIAGAGQHAYGCVYRHVPASALRRLDAFEGPWYARVQVRVLLVGQMAGSDVLAHTYRLHPAATARLAEHRWLLDVFMQTQRARFARVLRDRRRHRVRLDRGKS